uniref:Reverse transcriptase Ty1/copia-type domain-containing protein n=1 Tax=Tanacetum cinerariifolium TaxID=118510 RepID=A0A6L2MTK6_TANCI|nr:hypothetical protein [Tanacetum cinerariifolium]
MYSLTDIRNLKLNDEEGISSLPNTKLFENLALMGYNILPNQRFTFQKGQFSHQWKFLILTIMQCLSPKSTGFNEFNSNIATVVGEGLAIPTEPHHIPSPREQKSPHHDPLSPSYPTVTTKPIPTKTPTETPTLRQYSRRATRIAQSKALSPATDEPASLLRDDSQGEAFPLVSSLDAGQDMENINKTSALPHASTPKVTSLDADEGSMQQKLQELMELCTGLQRQQTQMASKIKAQDLEISGLKVRIKLLKDKDRGSTEPSRYDAPIKGRSMEIGEEVGVERSTELGSNDTKEMVNVLSSMEAINILTSGVVAVSVSTIAEVLIVGVPTVSGLFPTVSAIFTTTASVIDAQVARKMEEEIAREDQRLNEQLTRDAKIARIHAEEELKMLIDGLDRSNKVIVKHLQEYEQSKAELTIGEKIDLTNELVKYQDHHAKILKYQAQQIKPLSKKEQREFYISVLRSHAEWKTKHFRGMTLEEIKETFIPVWKQIEDFTPMSSKEKGKRVKRKGLRLEQGSVKRMKTSEDVSEEDLKEMMQLVPMEDVYVKALKVKHHIIDWEIHSEGKKDYWKIIKLGGHIAVYQFFIDMLKQFDREDLHQLWALVKETLSSRSNSWEQHKAFEKLMKDKFQMSLIGELTFFLGLQVNQKQDGIFISQDKYVAEILRKFGLIDGKSASTPMDTKKPLLKDPDGEDVDVHTYISIGSLMYLTSSRPNIMFAICACARLQVTPKASHLHAVKRIFRYLKGKPHLGLWYPKDSLFNLVAYSDSDYAGASLDQKSTTGGCQFLGCRLISWQCKKQTVMATSSTEAEYVAAASCCAQVLWIQNQLLDYGKGVFGVDTPLFKGMIVAQQDDDVAAEGAASVAVDDVPVAVDEPSIPSPTLPTQPSPPSQDLPSTLQVQPTPPPSLIDQPPSPQQQPQPSHNAKMVDTSEDTVMDDVSKQGRIIANMDADEDVTLKNVADIAKEVAVDDEIKESADDDEIEPAKLKEVVEVVTTAKLMTEVVTAANATNTAADTLIPAAAITTALSTARRRKGVVIRDPEETVTPSTIIHTEPKSKDKRKGIMVHEPKPLKKKTQIEQDEAYARELKRKPQTEAQAKKNMMIYLRNMVGFKMDYFKGMTYDEIRPIFEKKFNSNVAFLEKTKEQMEEEDSRALKRKATPLALKVPVVDYEIYTENNKPYYKIKRADGTHQLYLSFLSMLINFDREDLEVQWKLVKERFASSKPKNFSDDFLLTTLRAMFEKPDVQAQI